MPACIQTFYSNYLFGVRPVYDDRPFYHHYFRLGKIKEVYRSTGGKWTIFFEGGYLLPLVFIFSLLISGFFIVLPQLTRSRIPRGTGLSLIYFLLIGVSFILAEVTLIQKWILFVGLPGRAVPLVLSSVLVASGLGSMLSGYLGTGFQGKAGVLKVRGLSAPRLLPVVLLILGGVILFYGWGIDWFFDWGWAYSLKARCFWSLIVIFPLGVLLGMPFPLGIRLLLGDSARVIPWAWAANGFATVTGSVAASLLALELGFSMNFVFACAGYLGAGILGGVKLKIA